MRIHFSNAFIFIVLMCEFLLLTTDLKVPSETKGMETVYVIYTICCMVLFVLYFLLSLSDSSKITGVLKLALGFRYERDDIDCFAARIFFPALFCLFLLRVVPNKILNYLDKKIYIDL